MLHMGEYPKTQRVKKYSPYLGILSDSMHTNSEEKNTDAQIYQSEIIVFFKYL